MVYLPDLSKILQEPENDNAISNKQNENVVDEKALLENISNVSFKPFDDSSQNFEVLNNFEDFYAIDNSDPNDVLSFEEIAAAYEAHRNIILSMNNNTVLLSATYMAEDKTYICFGNVEMEVSEDQHAYVWTNGCRIYNDGSIKVEYADLLTRNNPDIEYENKDIISAINYATTEKANKADVLVKTEQTLTNGELTQIHKNLRFIDENKTFSINNVNWNGDGWFSGDVYVGSASGTNKDEGSKKLATEDFVLSNISNSTNMYIGTDDPGANSGIVWIDISE